MKAAFVLTGGMGSGKSTAGEVLGELGATVVDADNVVRDLRRPGQPGHKIMIEVLGEEIVGADQTLDKKLIAAKIFGDEALRREVETQMHPIVWREMHERVEGLPGIAVFEVPLLREPPEAVDGVIAVITERTKAIDRLVANRGYSKAEAEARLAAQPSNEERTSLADYLIENNGTHDEYLIAVSGAWDWMRRKATETP